MQVISQYYSVGDTEMSIDEATLAEFENCVQLTPKVPQLYAIKHLFMFLTEAR